MAKTNFKAIWDSVLPASKKYDLIGSITEGSINNYLVGHRKYDSIRYLVQKKFNIGGTDEFSLTAICGGNYAQHKKGTAKPISVALPNGKKPATIPNNFDATYEYPDAKTTPVSAVAESLANAVITCPNVHFILEYPRTSGGKWTVPLKGINFTLEVKLDLIQIENEYMLSFVPIKLYVESTATAKIKNEIIKSIPKSEKNEICEEKITDLIISVMKLASTQMGNNLSKSIKVPALTMKAFDIQPSFMAIKDMTLTVAAHIDTNSVFKEKKEQLDRAVMGVYDAFEKDIENAGGLERIMFTKKQVDMALELPEDQRESYFMNLEPRSDASIEKDLVLMNRYVAATLPVLAENEGFETTSSGTKLPTAKNTNMAIAISQFFLEKLMSDFGGIVKSGRTEERSALGLIKGYLGYELSVGKPVVSITNAGLLKGSVKVNAFGGLYYKLKKILDCSWRWSRRHKIGLGVAGDPEISIGTKTSNGLRIHAVPKGKLKFYTGLGGLVDKLLNLLLKPFTVVLDFFLKTIAAVIGMVVIPVKIEIPEQSTAMKMAIGNSVKYTRKGKSDPRSTFLKIEAESKAVKR